MSSRPDGPADTRTMGIVHEALRRDLRRAQGMLTSSPAPPLPQQQAIARHMTWMMGVLRDHHRSGILALGGLSGQRCRGRLGGSEPSISRPAAAVLLRSLRRELDAL